MISVKKKKKKPAQNGVSSQPQNSQSPQNNAEKNQKSEAKVTSAPFKVEEKWEMVKSRGSREGGGKGKKEQPAPPQQNKVTPSNSNKSKQVKEPKQPPKVQQQQQCEAIEPVKRLRNLKKKLKEIETLEERINSKDLKNPDKDQLNKVARKEEIEAAILALEVDISMGLK